MAKVNICGSGCVSSLGVVHRDRHRPPSYRDEEVLVIARERDVEQRNPQVRPGRADLPAAGPARFPGEAGRDRVDCGVLPVVFIGGPSQEAPIRGVGRYHNPECGEQRSCVADVVVAQVLVVLTAQPPTNVGLGEVESDLPNMSSAVGYQISIFSLASSSPSGVEHTRFRLLRPRAAWKISSLCSRSAPESSGS